MNNKINGFKHSYVFLMSVCFFVVVFYTAQHAWRLAAGNGSHVCLPWQTQQRCQLWEVPLLHWACTQTVSPMSLIFLCSGHFLSSFSVLCHHLFALFLSFFLKPGCLAFWFIIVLPFGFIAVLPFGFDIVLFCEFAIYCWISDCLLLSFGFVVVLA